MTAFSNLKDKKWQLCCIFCNFVEQACLVLTRSWQTLTENFPTHFLFPLGGIHCLKVTCISGALPSLTLGFTDSDLMENVASSLDKYFTSFVWTFSLRLSEISKIIMLFSLVGPWLLPSCPEAAVLLLLWTLSEPNPFMRSTYFTVGSASQYSHMWPTHTLWNDLACRPVWQMCQLNCAIVAHYCLHWPLGNGGCSG